MNLIIKWSDSWLANVDCNGDGKLDRGLDTKTGFVKTVFDDGAACKAGNPSCLWNFYTIIEPFYNDPHCGFHGNDRDKLVNPAGLTSGLSGLGTIRRFNSNEWNLLGTGERHAQSLRSLFLSLARAGR